MMAGGQRLLDGTGRRVLATDGRRLLTRADGKACRCCGSVDCYADLNDGSTCDGPKRVAESYRLALNGITLADSVTPILASGLGPALGTRYFYVVDDTMPAELCEARVDYAGYRQWQGGWADGYKHPYVVGGGTTPASPRPTAADDFAGWWELGVRLYHDPVTDPGKMILQIRPGVHIGGAAVHPIIFHGEVTGLPCDLRGVTFRVYNDLVAGTQYDDVIFNDRYAPVGTGGYVDVTPCCPCPCPVPLLSAYAASIGYSGNTYAGIMDLVGGDGTELDDDGNPIQPECYYQSFADGCPVTLYLVRNRNPCGWTVIWVGQPNISYITIPGDDPTGTYFCGYSPGAPTLTIS